MSGPDSPASIVAQMRERFPHADPQKYLPEVHPARIPRHIAIIMDGNGRWAKAQGMPRVMGHRAGAKSVRAVLEAAMLAGVEQITLYSFSIENWKRPEDEVAELMKLCCEQILSNADSLIADGIRFRVIGRTHGLPQEVQQAIAALEESSKDCSAATLCLALNYGSRAEIADAAKRIAEDVAAGKLAPGDVDEDAVEQRLYTAGMPEPDLLIRTAGEMRVSNYLLWQISYAEFFVTETCWPDFGAAELYDAIRAFAGRKRRFGGLLPGEESGAASGGAPDPASV